MKSRIWRLATVGLLFVSVSGQVLAEEPRGEQNPFTLTLITGSNTGRRAGW